MQLNNHDILFCYRDHILSESIRFIDGAEYSHVAIVKIIGGKVFIYDAQIDGVKLRPYEEWMNKFDYSFTIIRKPNMTEKFARSVDAKIQKYLGSKYDKVGLLKQFWLRIYERLFRKDASIRTDDEKLYCSELVALVFSVKNKDVTPQQLYHIFQKREYIEIN